MSTFPTYPMRPRTGGDFTGSVLKGDSRYRGEPKIDGIRMVANIRTGEAWNRHGQRLTDEAHYADHFLLLAGLLPESVTWVDCESTGRYKGAARMLFVLDLPDLHGSYLERRSVLERHVPVWDWDPDPTSHVYAIPSGSPRTVWNKALAVRGLFEGSFMEGIVIKRADSLYDRQRATAARDATTWVKFRFSDGTMKPVDEPSLSAPLPKAANSRAEVPASAPEPKLDTVPGAILLAPSATAWMEMAAEEEAAAKAGAEPKEETVLEAVRRHEDNIWQPGSVAWFHRDYAIVGRLVDEVQILRSGVVVVFAGFTLPASECYADPAAAAAAADAAGLTIGIS